MATLSEDALDTLAAAQPDDRADAWR